MSRKEIVLMVSRAVAVILASWALVDLTYLPERILSLSHHLSQRSVLGPPDYLTNYYWLATIFIVARSVGLLLVALWFWKCGPRVERLFVGTGS